MSAWADTAASWRKIKSRWHGTLVLVGQPAEEGGGGAAGMLKDGLFTRFPRPDFALSLHDDDTMPAGVIGYHPGLFRSMSDGVTIVVHGRGGHAAMAMNTVDPIVLAARIVVALQTVVSRESNLRAPRETDVRDDNAAGTVVVNDPALTARLALALKAALATSRSQRCRLR